MRLLFGVFFNFPLQRWHTVSFTVKQGVVVLSMPHPLCHNFPYLFKVPTWKHFQSPEVLYSLYHLQESKPGATIIRSWHFHDVISTPHTGTKCLLNGCCGDRVKLHHNWGHEGQLSTACSFNYTCACLTIKSQNVCFVCMDRMDLTSFSSGQYKGPVGWRTAFWA